MLRKLTTGWLPRRPCFQVSFLELLLLGTSLTVILMCATHGSTGQMAYFHACGCTGGLVGVMLATRLASLRTPLGLAIGSLTGAIGGGLGYLILKPDIDPRDLHLGLQQTVLLGAISGTFFSGLFALTLLPQIATRPAPKEGKELTHVLRLLLLLACVTGAYLVTYSCLVQRKYRDGFGGYSNTPVGIWKSDRNKSVAKYRFGGQWTEKVFTPIHRLDRAARDGYWD